MNRVGKGLDRRIGGGHQRHKAGGQLRHVPRQNIGLIVIGIAPILVDRGIDRDRVIAVHEGRWAIVDGFARQAGVVGVHDPVNEPDGQPFHDQINLSRDHGIQKFQRGFRFGVMALAGIIEQGLQRFGVAAGGEILERSHADMAGGHAGQDCAGQFAFTQDGFACGHGGQRAGGGNAKGKHCFGQQIFAQDRPQPCPPIAPAGIGGGTGPFELNIAAVPVVVDHFAQQDCAAIAQLRGKPAELMPGIGLRQRGRPFGDQITGKDLRHFRGRAGGDPQIGG